jgi:ornithine cyclodeaminase/alanine dehydrogenase-like protein (mu-crystallin family)
MIQANRGTAARPVCYVPLKCLSIINKHRDYEMRLRVLSEADCRAVLGMAAAIDLQAEAFALLAERASVQGLRSFAMSDDPPGVAIFNPSFLLGGRGYGVKIISDFYLNEKHGATRMTGLVALFDGRTGYPTTVMEAGYLTDLRTGAGTGLAARYLARPDSRSVAVIGAGRVARNQLEALAELFDIDRVTVTTRSEARGREFVARMNARPPKRKADIQLMTSAEEAVRRADIVVAATTSSHAVCMGEWLSPGTFVVAAGAHQANSREVDSETIRRAHRHVIDSRADCLDHAGDLVIPIAEGIITREDVAEISELVSGAKPGRQSDAEITYYKSIGVPIQDLVTAQHIARRAAAAGIGAEIEIGGEES